MGPLTWRDVAAPDFSSAARILESAATGVKEGFGGIGKVLQDTRNRQIDNRSADALGKLATIKGSGNVDSVLQSVLGSINPNDRNADLQEALLGAQAKAADLDNSQSVTRDRDGRLVIAGNDSRSQNNYRDGSLTLAQNADGRQALTHSRGIQREDQLAGLGRTLAGELGAFSGAIDKTESGGGADQYDTLYGHRNRQNGVQVSRMTLGQAKEFSTPNGEYGQSVNNEIGRVATPMGKYQIVGSTLRKIQDDLGLPDEVQFNPDVQELMGTYLGQRRVSGPRSQESMREGLRSEWEGFKNKSDAELDVIIDELQNTPPVTRDQIIAAGSGGGLPAGSNSAEQAILASIANNPNNMLSPADVAAQRTSTLGITDDRTARADEALLKQLTKDAEDDVSDLLKNVPPEDVSVQGPLLIEQAMQDGRITEQQGRLMQSELSRRFEATPGITSEGFESRQIEQQTESLVKSLKDGIISKGTGDLEADRYAAQQAIVQADAAGTLGMPIENAYAAVDRVFAEYGTNYTAGPNAPGVESEAVRSIVGEDIARSGQVATDLSAEGHLNAVANASSVMPYGNLDVSSFNVSPITDGDSEGAQTSQRQSAAEIVGNLADKFGPDSISQLDADQVFSVAQRVIRETGLPAGVVFGEIENSLNNASLLSERLDLDESVLRRNLGYALDENGKADPSKLNQAQENVQQMQRTQRQIQELNTKRQEVASRIEVLATNPPTPERDSQITTKYQQLISIEQQMASLAENARAMSDIVNTPAEDVEALKTERSELQRQNAELARRSTAFSNAGASNGSSSVDQIIQNALGTTPPPTAGGGVSRPAPSVSVGRGSPNFSGTDIDAYLNSLR